MTVRSLPFLFLFLSLVLISGCGSKKTAAANISGKVTLNGQPVAGGSMYFHSDAGSYAATIDPQGNYRLVDIPPGEMTVTIDNEFLDPNRKAQVYTGGNSGPGAMKSTPGAGKYGAAMGGAAPKYQGKGVDLAKPPEGAQTVKDGSYIKIPDVYKKKESSTIKVKIEAGDNDRNIELTGK